MFKYYIKKEKIVKKKPKAGYYVTKKSMQYFVRHSCKAIYISRKEPGSITEKYKQYL